MPTLLDHPVGDVYERRFDAPGTYRYFCKVHPNMRGTLTVATPDADAPVVSRLRATRQRGRVVVRLRLSEAARLVLEVRRGSARRRVVRDAAAGEVAVRLPADLPRGRALVTVRARDAAGNLSAARRLRISVR
jgi:hypothetical protein